MKEYIKPVMELKSLIAKENVSADELGQEVPVVSYPSNWFIIDN